MKGNDVHQSQPYDAIVIGGSFAGLSAAMYLGRARRSVLVLDTGTPRNRFASASHGFFAQDGSDPRTMIAAMRQQVAAYPTVTFLDLAAVSATRQENGLAVGMANGEVVICANLLLAHGIKDILPDLPGIAERWGRSVIHCPYCHGYEYSGQRLGVLYLSPLSLHQATLIPEWGPTTLFLNGAVIEPDARDMLIGRGVVVEPQPIDRLVGEGANLSAVRFEDGSEYALDALFIGPRYSFTSDISVQLSCEIDDGPLGPSVIVDEMKATNVPGVFAAGDITRMGHTVTFACADGVAAALAIHRSLVFGDSR